jgi:DNA processing protein
LPSEVKLRRPADLAEEGRAGSRQPKAGRQPLEWPRRFGRDDRERRALLVLLSLASLTPRRLLELATREGTAEACLAAVSRGEAGSEGDRSFAAAIRPEEVDERLERARGRLVRAHDPEYPKQLLDLFDPPAGFFVRGRPLDPDSITVAIVGARNCSPSGAETASLLARTLGQHGATVVSGGARGIDGAAHHGALQSGGRTVAVLGCGIDVAYPSQNRRLFDSILERGSIVSEYPPGTPAEPFRFPARNRIVAALSRAVVVVEGATGSGSMITAEHALDLGREVFAVPGAITSALAQVPLALLREGATLIRGPDDLVSDLGLEPILPGPRDSVASGDSPSMVSLAPRESAVWEALTAPAAPDHLAEGSGLGLGDVVAALVGLELRGLVRQTGGRYERRAVTPGEAPKEEP